MVKVQTPDAATGYHTTREEREFSEDGSTMTLRFQGIFTRWILKRAILQFIVII